MIEFDGVPIRTSDEFLMRVKRALPYSTVKLVVMRGPVKVKRLRMPRPTRARNSNNRVESKPFQKLEIPVKMGKQ